MRQIWTKAGIRIFVILCIIAIAVLLVLLSDGAENMAGIAALVIALATCFGIAFLVQAILATVGTGLFGARSLPQDLASVPRRPCPHCAELIMPTAHICRFCGRDLIGTDLTQET